MSDWRSPEMLAEAASVGNHAARPRCTGVSDLSPLSGLSGLTELDLSYTKVTDLSPLAGLKNLRQVTLSKDQQVTIPPSLEETIRRD